jgi:formylglycine-generating enzyme required for sulfatase activity
MGLVIESGNRGPEAEPKARVFISYSRKDMGFADTLDAALKARGFEPLIDRTEIYAFEEWWRRIQSLIVKADTVIFVLSPDAISSDTCQREVAFAASLKKRFAPIVCRPVDISKVPAELSRLNFISFEDQTHFERNADQLEDALSTNIEWIRKHTEFGGLARRWEEAGKPRGLLLRSPALEEAEAWVARQPRRAPAPSQATPLFILESRKGENLARVRARRTRIALIALVLLLIGAGVGWWKQEFLKEQYYWHVVMKPAVLTPGQERALAPKGEFSECAHGCPMLVVVPAGSFTMGSPEGEKGSPESTAFLRMGSGSGERPQHTVTFAKPFAVGKYDVTFAEWDACVATGACARASDNGWGRDNRPVISVSWDEAKGYVAWLSRVTGKHYRLLSEAEWEYAARAGSNSRFYFGDDESELDQYAWYAGNSSGQTHPVGQKKANAFGLYDMHGNVWQWVEDVYHDGYKGAPNDGSAWIIGRGDRVVRGGSYYYGPEKLRAASRSEFTADYRSDTFGFRVARTLTP